MITAEIMKSALCEHIERATNTLTVPDRLDGKAEKGYVVSVKDLGSVIIDGGRQLERTMEIAVIIVHSKMNRDGGTMKKRLFDSLFPYFQIQNRRFVPLDAKDEKKEGMKCITFNVHFCDTLDRDNAEAELMGNIILNITGGQNGITTDSHQL